ncbi:MAG: hypothetical protein P1U89_27685 [Verrucomicrobiales bacterium]|nr:hypothetical protein [Verrucomicrobiales bacterium]
MNLIEAISEEHSKSRASLISVYIGESREHFSELMDLILGENLLLACRASWVMTHCEDAPVLAAPYFEKLLARISKDDAPPAVKRNTIKLFQEAEIPAALCGDIFNLCYEFLNNPDETAAVRIYSMTVLGRICQSEPELVDEIRLLIKQHLPYSSAGYKARARRVLKELDDVPKK